MKLEATPIILILTAEIEGILHTQALASSMYHNLLKIRQSPIFTEQRVIIYYSKVRPNNKPKYVAACTVMKRKMSVHVCVG